VRIGTDKIIIANADILRKCKKNEKAYPCQRGDEMTKGGSKQVINEKTEECDQKNIKENEGPNSRAKYIK